MTWQKSCGWVSGQSCLRRSGGLYELAHAHAVLVVDISRASISRVGCSGREGGKEGELAWCGFRDVWVSVLKALNEVAGGTRILGELSRTFKAAYPGEREPHLPPIASVQSPGRCRRRELYRNVRPGLIQTAPVLPKDSFSSAHYRRE